MPICAVALRARIPVHGPQRLRAIAADDFLVGTCETALEPGGMLTGHEVWGDRHMLAEPKRHLAGVLFRRALRALA